MPVRKKPTVNIDELGKPDATPEKQVGEYIESVQQNDNFIKAPVWDTVGEGLEEFYLAARVEHSAMMRERDILMEHKEVQGKTDERRLRDLKQSQDELQEKFIQVNAFLRDFEEKRVAAVKKGNNQLIQQQAMQEQKAGAQAVIDDLREFRNKLLATTEEYAPYEEVLNDVVERHHAFSSVKELMDRCDGLLLAQVEINEITEQKALEIELMRKRLVAVASEAALEVLGLKNTLSTVDRLYDVARTECLKWERQIQTVKAIINNGVIGKDRVLESVNHLYRMLCSRRGITPLLAHEDVEGRMGFIRSEVELLQDILAIQQSRNKKASEVKADITC